MVFTTTHLDTGYRCETSSCDTSWRCCPTGYRCETSIDSPGHGIQVRDLPRLTWTRDTGARLLPATRLGDAVPLAASGTRHLEHHIAVGGATDVLGTRRTRLIVAPATPRTRPHARRPRRHARHVRWKTTATAVSHRWTLDSRS